MALRLPKDIPGAAVLNNWSRQVESELAKVGTKLSNAHHIAHRAHNIAVTSNPTASGGVGAVAAGNFGYTATTTSITIYWDGTNSSNQFTVHLTDGTTHTVPKSSISVTGLTSNTTYKFYPYYSIDAAEVVFCVGGTGSPTIAFTAANTTAASIQILNGNIPLASPTLSLATPASGSGGGTGGGGSGCLAGWTYVVTPDGPRRIDACKEGDEILAPQGWTTIKFLKRHLADKLYTVTTANGCQIFCTATHPLSLLDSRWAVPEATLGRDLVTLTGPSAVVDVTETEENFVAYHPGCEPYHEFWSNGILTHNFMFEK